MSDLFIRPLFTWRSAVASKFGPESPVTRHVLLTLSLHMSERGDSCFPSLETLAEETGLSLRAVKQHMLLAGSAGWFSKRERRRHNGQNWRSMEYFAQIPPGVEAMFHEEQAGASGAPPQAGAPGAPPAQETGEGGACGSKGGAPERTKVVHDVHPSTSKSTSMNSTDGGTSPDGDSPAFCEIPLVGKQGTHIVTEAKVAEWQEAYPGIDVRQWVRTIRQWNVANAGRRKTRKGIEAHINTWLAKEQNRAPAAVLAPSQPRPVDRRCTESVAGQPCGMPGTRYGGTFMCNGHREKLLSQRGMPNSVREQLGLRAKAATQ